MNGFAALICAAVAASLEDALRAFAACESDTTRQKMEARFAFFESAGARSEDDVRALPEHRARNEQEAILSLQRKLLPDGARVRMRGLKGDQVQWNLCEGNVITCLQDGSFLCALEVFKCGTTEDTELPRVVRVRLEHLRPTLDCSVARTADSCDRLDAANDVGPSLPLDEVSVGSMLTEAVMTHRSLVASGELPAAAAELGQTAFPDMPYAALLLVCVKLQSAGCVALHGGDINGAGLATSTALELERQARRTSVEMHELPLAIRQALAALMSISSTVKGMKGDVDGARADSLSAQALNSTTAVCPHKVRMALGRSQRAAPYDMPGLKAQEVVRLQRWWVEELLPLDV